MALSIWSFENKYEVVAVCDNSKAKQEKVLFGHKILSVEECVKQYGENVNYVIAVINENVKKELYFQLRVLGIGNLSIFRIDFLGNKRFKKPFLYSDYAKTGKLQIAMHSQEIDEVSGMLEDEKSVCVYTKMLSRLFNGCITTISEDYFEPEGYFNYDFLKYESGEKLIQCGVLDGGTIQEFINICPDYDKIIGVEADINNFMNSLWVTKQRNVELRYNAVSDKRAILSFDNRGNGKSKISDAGQGTVLGICGDELGVNPTMIQMDIEGAELPALKGFKNTIINNKPKLAICIYHSRRDYWEIPLYIKSLVPEYRFWVRCDSKANSVQEVVLYASV